MSPRPRAGRHVRPFAKSQHQGQPGPGGAPPAAYKRASGWRHGRAHGRVETAGMASWAEAGTSTGGVPKPEPTRGPGPGRAVGTAGLRPQRALAVHAGISLTALARQPSLRPFAGQARGRAPSPGPAPQPLVLGVPTSMPAPGRPLPLPSLATARHRGAARALLPAGIAPRSSTVSALTCPRASGRPGPACHCRAPSPHGSGGSLGAAADVASAPTLHSGAQAGRRAATRHVQGKCRKAQRGGARKER